MIYCDYDIRPERFSFSIWVVPIKQMVWMFVFISVFIICLVLLIHRRILLNPKQMIATYIPLNDVFDIFSIIVRQDVSSSKGSIMYIFPILFILLSFSSLILLSEYEFFVTAELVVPEVSKKLDSLPEIIHQGFILHSRIHPDSGTYIEFEVRETMKNDFAKWNISHKLNSSVKEVGRSEWEVIKLFSKSRPQFAMILRSLPFQGILYLRLVNLQLKERYNCHLVTNVVDRRTIYDEFLIAIGARCKQLMDNLREAGFYIVWEKWMELAADISLMIERRQAVQGYSKMTADYISFTNLLSFQIVFGVLLMLATLIFGIEWLLAQMRKTRTHKIVRKTAKAIS